MGNSQTRTAPITVVIATARRPAWLRRALESIQSERGPFRSVRVVINDPSDRRTRCLVSEFGPESRVPVEWIEPEAEVHPGAARNAALQDLETEWVLFLDDDAFLPPGFAESVRRVLADAALADLVGGPNLTPPGASAFSRSAGRALASAWGAWFSRKRFAPGRAQSRGATDHDLMLCNLLARARGPGGAMPWFDPELLCAEENELIRRWIARGARVAYDPRFWVFHERRSSLAAFFRQVFVYARGRVQAVATSPGGLHWAHGLPALCVLWAGCFGLAIGLGKASPLFLALPLGLYAALTLFFSSLARDPRLLWIYPTIHAAYGLGFLWEGGRISARILARAHARGRSRALSSTRG